MNTEFYCFGEILWDCLPFGKHAGGAPFNVAAHLAQLGVSSSLISAVGQDALGDEILAVAEHKRVNVDFVTRARVGLATGTVLVSLDANGNAAYEIVQPAAWDEIHLSDAALAAVSHAGAFIYGSLAGRSPYNLDQLSRLLTLKGPLRFFDVNLRPPFAAPAQIMSLAQHADIIKLNHDEVGQLASYIRTSALTPNPPTDDASISEACATLAGATNTSCICVTRGAAGAALWDDGALVTAPAPPVVVKDTVGAGDAFMAGLMVGLTRGIDKATALNAACRIGAYVASHNGATPLLPPELIQELGAIFKIDPAQAYSEAVAPAFAP